MANFFLYIFLKLEIVSDNFSKFWAIAWSPNVKVLFSSMPFKLHKTISYIQILTYVQTSTCMFKLNMRMRRKKIRNMKMLIFTKCTSYNKDLE